MNPTQSKHDAETVRAALAARGKTIAQAAEHCGNTPRSLLTRLSEGLTDPALRSKLENFFGYEISLGSDAQLLNLRRRCFAALAVDPWTLKKPAIQQFCETFNVRDWRTATTTDALLEKITAHLFANPSLLKPA